MGFYGFESNCIDEGDDCITVNWPAARIGTRIERIERIITDFFTFLLVNKQQTGRSLCLQCVPEFVGID